MSGTINFEFDYTRLEFLTASEAASNTDNVLSFEFTDLLPFQIRYIDLDFRILPPPINNSGDVLVSTTTINPISGDDTATDNVFTLEQTLVNAYDPNDIRVLEGEEITMEPADKYLHYIFRFQNTGTVSAVNIRVNNILDDKFDWSSLSLESLSRVEVIDGNNVNFIFDNINLPDSTANEPASHGFITYKIKPKGDVELGNIFENTANIYFDYNAPITTNTAVTEIVSPTSTRTIAGNIFSIYPNPVEAVLMIASERIGEQVSIYDVNGNPVSTFVKNDRNLSFNTSSLNSG